MSCVTANSVVGQFQALGQDPTSWKAVIMFVISRCVGNSPDECSVLKLKGKFTAAEGGGDCIKFRQLFTDHYYTFPIRLGNSFG